MRYSVVVMCDTIPRVYGIYRTHERAKAFADAVNQAVQEEEDRQVAEQRAQGFTAADMLPHLPSWAHVRIIHPVAPKRDRMAEAIQFAIDESVPS